MSARTETIGRRGPVARLNFAAIVVAGLVAFCFSLVWYGLLFGWAGAATSGEEATVIPIWKMLVAPLREQVSALALAWLMTHLGIRNWKGAVGLGLGLWFAFYVVQLAGAVIFEGMLPAMGAIHAGDWLGKMLIMALIINAWRQPPWSDTASF